MVKIDKDMTITEVLELDRNTVSVFLQFGMYCLGCPAASGESLEQAAAVHGINLDELLGALNGLLAEN